MGKVRDWSKPHTLRAKRTKKWDKVAHAVLRRRNGSDSDKFGVAPFDYCSDKCVLIDCRPERIRSPQWVGFRNYLYGWRCKILAEVSPCGATSMK
jgi:hypothetical protein